MDESNIKKICIDANEIFIQESLSDYPKFKYLPSWLKNKSFYLKKERANPHSKYKVFRRGAIVYVDFGVNVGYELSGNHFAIVVNKKDNPNNGIITVIPISSKVKSSYISVGKVIEIQSIKHFASQIDKLNSELHYFLRALVHKNILTIKSLEKISHEWVEMLNTKTEITGELAVKKVSQSGVNLEDSSKILEKTKNISNDIKAYKKVFASYQKYTKESYAMPLNIQSISKHRIKKINKFDPSSRITAPADVMVNIDSAIVELFTK